MYGKIRCAFFLISILLFAAGCVHSPNEIATPGRSESAGATRRVIETVGSETSSPTAVPPTRGQSLPLTVAPPTRDAPIQAAKSTEDAIEMATRELSKSLGVSASKVKVVRAERTEISPARLPPEPQQSVKLDLPAEVFGYEIVLRADGKEYRCYVYRSRVACTEER